jgi:hypothetical protein
MAIVYSENATHRANLLAAEGIRQAACAGATAAAIKTAEIAFYRTCVTSALANGCDAAQFQTALQELGVGGV